MRQRIDLKKKRTAKKEISATGKTKLPEIQNEFRIKDKNRFKVLEWEEGREKERVETQDEIMNAVERQWKQSAIIVTIKECKIAYDDGRKQRSEQL